MARKPKVTPLEQITSEDVWKNMQGRNAGRFVGPMPQEVPVVDSISAAPYEPPALGRNVGPKNIGAFGMKTTFGGAQPIDVSGGVLGELYRQGSKASGRYIPGLEQMWGNQPDANKWVEDADAAYKAARSGLSVHSNQNNPKNVFGSISAKTQNTQDNATTNYPNVEDVFLQQRKEYIEKNVPNGSGYIRMGNKIFTGEGQATGGFGMNEGSRLAEVDRQNREEAFRRNASTQQSVKDYAEAAQGRMAALANEASSARNLMSSGGWGGLAVGKAQLAALAPQMQSQGATDASALNSLAGYAAKANEEFSQGPLRIAQGQHYGAQNNLLGSQASGALVDTYIKREALKGDPNALNVIGHPQKNTSDKIISALGDILKTNPDLANKPDVLNQILQSTISSTREAEDASKKGLVYRQIAPAIPGVKRWSLDPRSDIPEKPAQYSYVKP